MQSLKLLMLVWIRVNSLFLILTLNRWNHTIPKGPWKFNNKNILTILKLTIIHWSVSTENEPWSLLSIDIFQVIFQPFVLPWSRFKVVLSTHHYEMHEPVIIAIPSKWSIGINFIVVRFRNLIQFGVRGMSLLGEGGPLTASQWEGVC